MSTNLNNLNLNLSGSEISLRRVEVAATSVLKNASSTYNEHAKLVFMFDVSGSMGCEIMNNRVDQFLWTAEKLDEIRAAVTTALDLKANGVDAADPLISQQLKMVDPDDGTGAPQAFNPKDDADVKDRVVGHGLVDFFGVPKLPWEQAREERAKTPRVTRIEAVKKLAKQEIAARFDKYPKSRVAVVPFGSYPVVLCDDASREEMMEKLETLSTCMGDTGGGTDILSGLRCGMEVCRKRPSAVGIHHFVMVSDGEDGGTRALNEWIPSFKASGIVLDYIHIGDGMVNESLRLACKATGGECVVVNTVRDLETKFVEAAGRLLLPPGK